MSVTELPPGYEDEDWGGARAIIMPPKPTPKQKTNGHAAPTPAPPFTRPIIDPINWQDKPLPVLEWVVPTLIPKRVVTMLSGDGGLGKSTLALQGAVACATDGHWLGLKTLHTKVLLIACEDDPDELQRRLYGILVDQNKEFGDLENLRIIPGVGFDNILMDFEDFGNHGKATEFCHWVAEEAERFGAQLIILDSLHDFFGGNEVLRPQARQFINHLRTIAAARDGAVLLLSHPSLSGLKDKTGSAGSTAWNNTVRSRLYLSKSEDTNNPGLSLKTMKANYGPSGGEIKLEYRGGCFHAMNDPGLSTDPIRRAVQVDAIFLACLREARLQNRRIVDSKHGNYAPKIFAGMGPMARGLTPSDFEASMKRLYIARRIQNGTVADGTRNGREGIIEVFSDTVSNENPDL